MFILSEQEVRKTVKGDRSDNSTVGTDLIRGWICTCIANPIKREQRTL